MSSEAILQIIFAIIILNYLVDFLSGLLNYNSFNNKLPENVSDIYNDKEYLKSQEYKKENFRFNLITSSFSFIILIVVLYNGYFGALDSIVRNYTFENEISPSILFFFSTFNNAEDNFSIASKYLPDSKRMFASRTYLGSAVPCACTFPPIIKKKSI